MFWFITHNIIHNALPNKTNQQNKNLTTFLIGVVLYMITYSYLYTFTITDNYFLHMFNNFLLYIIAADGFAMAIIYKNYWNKSILSEVKDTFDNKEKLINSDNENESENENNSENESENENENENDSEDELIINI